jgi:hypothetical protein
LERLSAESFLPYPYVDTFEDADMINNWSLGGSWGRVDNRAWRPTDVNEHSLTDSPYTLDGNGDPQKATYATNQSTTATLHLALDVNNDSPLNPFSPDCALVPSILCDEPDNTTPDNPIMTFQWWHDFGSSGGEDFYVEWKKADSSDTVWKELWSYQSGMAFDQSSDSSTYRQWDWQRVEVDLRSILINSSFDNNLPDSTTDDDILFRFRFTTNSNNDNADGVYIDEIHIEDRQEKTFALWDKGLAADIENPGFPSTGPLIFTTGTFRYVRMVADSASDGSSTAGAAEFNLLDKNGNTIDRSAWNVTYVDSERSSTYSIDKMLDGDTNTYWRSGRYNVFPHEFQIIWVVIIK